MASERKILSRAELVNNLTSMLGGKEFTCFVSRPCIEAILEYIDHPRQISNAELEQAAAYHDLDATHARAFLATVGVSVPNDKWHEAVVRGLARMAEDTSRPFSDRPLFEIADAVLSEIKPLRERSGT